MNVLYYLRRFDDFVLLCSDHIENHKRMCVCFNCITNGAISQLYEYLINVSLNRMALLEYNARINSITILADVK